MKIIIITGTPGTGKTTLAKYLIDKLKYKYIDVTKLISQSNLKEGYDKKRKCFIVDERKLVRELIKKIKCEQKNSEKQNLLGIIIDSHLSHYLPKKYVDLCIVTRCELKLLQKRLKKRGYSKDKIRENLDCEIFNVCLNEAVEFGHKVIVIDTNKRFNYDKILDKVLNQESFS